MKQLIRNTILFLVPVLLVLLFLPVNQRLKFEGLENDCFNHGLWIFDRIHHNPKSVDIALIGSSRTINGISDQLIEVKLKQEKQEFSVANFGYCRLGRNLHYTLLKEICEEKPPQYLVLEVRENEGRYSHPIFPYVSGTADVMLASPFFNRDLFSNYWTHLVYKLNLTQDLFFNSTTATPFNLKDFGSATSKDTADYIILEQARKRREIPKPDLSPTMHRFHLKYPGTYLQKIANLCTEQEISIIFLYLPAYGSPQEKPNEYDTYKELGKILLPPDVIFDNKQNWFDENHLNQAGAEKLSLWLANEIQRIIE